MNAGVGVGANSQKALCGVEGGVGEGVGRGGAGGVGWRSVWRGCRASDKSVSICSERYPRGTVPRSAPSASTSGNSSALVPASSLRDVVRASWFGVVSWVLFFFGGSVVAARSPLRPAGTRAPRWFRGAWSCSGFVVGRCVVGFIVCEHPRASKAISRLRFYKCFGAAARHLAGACACRGGWPAWVACVAFPPAKTLDAHQCVSSLLKFCRATAQYLAGTCARRGG